MQLLQAHIYLETIATWNICTFKNVFVKSADTLL